MKSLCLWIWNFQEVGGTKWKNHGNFRGWGEYCKAPWNGKSCGVGTQTGKNPPWGSMNIFWIHTLLMCDRVRWLSSYHSFHISPCAWYRWSDSKLQLTLSFSLGLQCAVLENIHAPPQKGLEFPGEVGGSMRPKKLRNVWSLTRISRGVGRCQKKSLPWGSYGYFLELHNESGYMVIR